MSTQGQPGQFAWRCARPEQHQRHRIEGDGYYGPAGYICDGEPRPVHVGLDAWALRPVPIDTVAKLITEHSPTAEVAQ